MDDYDYESDSYDEDVYDDDLDIEPFFGNLLKTQSQIEEEQAKEKEQKQKAQEEKERKKAQEEKERRTRASKRVEVASEDEALDDATSTIDDYVSDGRDDDVPDDDDYEEEDTKVGVKRKSPKRDKKCLICYTSDPKTKYFALKGPKCRRDDFVGKLHKLLGTIPVFCLPGNPYICDPCYKKILECYSTWDLGFTSVTDYLEAAEPENVPKFEIKALETKLQRVVKKFCLEKLSHLDEDVTIMGNVYVSLGERAMVMFPIDSTAEIETQADDDDDDDDNDDDGGGDANVAQEEETREDPADISFRSEDVGGILDANMGNIDIAFGDIEVDVAFFGSSTADKSDGLNADFDTLIKAEPKALKEVDNDIELDVETEPGAIKRGATKPSTQNEKDKKAQIEDQKRKQEAEKKKKEPSVTVNISYKDIQKAEEALIKGNPTEGRCPACKILFFPGAYIRHTDTSERRKCDYCVFQTSLACVLKKHEKKNHKNVANKATSAVTNTAKALFKCDKCSKCFVTHFLLNKHRIFFHGSKMIYPEYIKSRAEDEMSLGSSGDEDSEEDVGQNDPDYHPSYWDDDDVVPKVKTKKKKEEKKKEEKKKEEKKKVGPLLQGAYSGTGGYGPRKRSICWYYFELTNNFIDGRPTARCLMCSREVARKQSSTWAMMSHLKTYHKDIDLTRYPSGNQQTDANGIVDGPELMNGETVVMLPISQKRKAEDQTSGNAGKRERKAEDQDSEVSIALAPETQFVVGSFGEIQLATPDVLNSLKEKGVHISKFVTGGTSDGRLSPTSAAVASITESDQTVNSLLTQSVEISNAEGVNIPISELLDGNTPDSSADGGNENKQGKQNISGDKYVTQYVRDRKTGELLKFRVPEKSIDPSRIKPGSGT